MQQTPFEWSKSIINRGFDILYIEDIFTNQALANSYQVSFIGSRDKFNKFNNRDIVVLQKDIK